MLGLCWTPAAVQGMQKVASTMPSNPEQLLGAILVRKDIFNRFETTMHDTCLDANNLLEYLFSLYNSTATPAERDHLPSLQGFGFMQKDSNSTKKGAGRVQHAFSNQSAIDNPQLPQSNIHNRHSDSRTHPTGIIDGHRKKIKIDQPNFQGNINLAVQHPEYCQSVGLKQFNNHSVYHNTSNNQSLSVKRETASELESRHMHPSSSLPPFSQICRQGSRPYSPAAAQYSDTLPTHHPKDGHKNFGLDVRDDHRLDIRGDHNLEIRGDRTLELRGDHNLEIRGDRTLELRGDPNLEMRSDRSLDIRSDRSLDIRSDRSLENRGDHSLDARGDRSLEIRGDRSLEIRSDRSLENRGDHNLEIRGDHNLEIRGELNSSGDVKMKLEEAQPGMLGDQQANKIIQNSSKLAKKPKLKASGESSTDGNNSNSGERTGRKKKSHQCFCGALFTRADNLKRHIRKCHEEKLEKLSGTALEFDVDNNAAPVTDDFSHAFPPSAQEVIERQPQSSQATQQHQAHHSQQRENHQQSLDNNMIKSTSGVKWSCFCGETFDDHCRLVEHTRTHENNL